MATLNISNFPDDLYLAHIKLAKNKHRSLSQEVIHLLKSAVINSKKKKTSILKLQGLGKKLWNEIDTNGHINNERNTWD